MTLDLNALTVESFIVETGVEAEADDGTTTTSIGTARTCLPVACIAETLKTITCDA